MNTPNISAKISEALSVLVALGLPREQHNERSALSLLALIDLRPEGSWLKLSSPLMGIRPMMDWMKVHYLKVYAENTRESVRRYSIHQFVDAGIVLRNPDDLSRPINSGKTVYQITPEALKLFSAYGTAKWQSLLSKFQLKNPALTKRYAKERNQKLIPVKIPRGKAVNISPGKHSLLLKAIVENFLPRFAPNASLVYVGDTGEKFGFFDPKLLASLGVAIDSHGKMPDIVLYNKTKNWLFLIESVTSHGPVNPKRQDELSRLFAASTASLVFVTAFPDRTTMKKYLHDLAWETEVWIADNPSHMIHFNGDKFLGPYSIEK